MALSQKTLDNLLDAESNIRGALKSAAVNEKPLVVHQLTKLLMDIEHCRTFEDLMDIVDNHNVEV